MVKGRGLCLEGLAVWVAFFLITMAFEWVYPGYYFNDDNQAYFMTAARECAAAWREGSFPLLALGGSQGSNLGGEYQPGVFHLVYQFVAVVCSFVTTESTVLAALLASFNTASVAGIVYCLGRTRGWSPGIAVSCSLSLAFQGWMRWATRVWLDAGVAMVSIHWLRFALEAFERKPTRWVQWSVTLGVYLVLASGWPFMDCIALLLLVESFLALVLVSRRNALRLFVCGFYGLCLASPALTMLFFYGTYSGRVQAEHHWIFELITPPQAFAGLLNPFFQADWGAFWLQRQSDSVDVNIGLLGIVPLLAVGRSLWHQKRRQLLALALAMVLAVLPTREPLEWAFRWLPLVALQLSLLSHQILHECRALRPGRRVIWLGLSLWAVVTLAVVFQNSFVGIGYAAFTLLASWLALIAWTRWPNRRPLILAGLTAVSVHPLWSQWTPLPFNIYYWGPEMTHPSTFEPARRYLSIVDRQRMNEVYAVNSAATMPAQSRILNRVDLLRIANFSRYAGLDFVNGYSGMSPIVGQSMALDEDVWGMTGCSQPMLHDLVRKGGLLSWFAVDGLLVDTRVLPIMTNLISEGWTSAEENSLYSVYHRTPGPRLRGISKALWMVDLERIIPYIYRDLPATGIPLVNDGRLSREGGQRLISYAECQPTNLQETRLTAEFDVVSQGGGDTGAVVLSRTWTPGYRAVMNGIHLPVRCCNLGEILIEVPDHSQGHVVLRYLPEPLVYSLFLVGLTLGLAIFTLKEP